MFVPIPFPLPPPKAKSDERLKRTNELLQGIKLIKLYGWEDMFYTSISKVRALEILTMMKQMGWRVVLSKSCCLDTLKY